RLVGEPDGQLPRPRPNPVRDPHELASWVNQMVSYLPRAHSFRTPTSLLVGAAGVSGWCAVADHHAHRTPSSGQCQIRESQQMRNNMARSDLQLFLTPALAHLPPQPPSCDNYFLSGAGVFRKEEELRKHLDAGAKHVGSSAQMVRYATAALQQLAAV
ncbi:MAG: hypothetical protein ACODAD_07085, partial [Planctomycetota bacterium]